jgi:hypothetical protein
MYAFNSIIRDIFAGTLDDFTLLISEGKLNTAQQFDLISGYRTTLSVYYTVSEGFIIFMHKGCLTMQLMNRLQKLPTQFSGLGELLSHYFCMSAHLEFLQTVLQ